MNTAVNTIPPAPAFEPERVGKHCLVTGGAGYVGSSIIRRLVAAGCTVRSFDVLDHELGASVETVTGDLRDYDAVRAACAGIDTVFHVAAIIDITEIARPSRKQFVHAVNCVGTDNLLRACVDAGVAALVQTSSFSVVLDRDVVDADETAPYATKTKDLYTLTKIEAEKSVLSADTAGGLRTCALRPGGVWGPSADCIMISSFLGQFASGKFRFTIGNGTSVMDNTHVENLVDAQLLAAASLHESPDVSGGQAYFINDDEEINPLEWFRPLVEGLGGTFPRFGLPAVMMQNMGRLMELIHVLGGPEPVLTRRGVRNLTESSRLCIDKARRDLGYTPRYNRDNGLPELLPNARSYVAKLQKKTA